MEVCNSCPTDALTIVQYLMDRGCNIFSSDQEGCTGKGNLSANWTFSLWCVPLIKSGSLNWPWFPKILGQLVTRMRKNWLILKIIGQCDVDHFDVTDKSNNASFEDLDRHYHHYHSLSCQTCCDTSDNVCLDLQNYRYSIYNKTQVRDEIFYICSYTRTSTRSTTSQSS